jgi:O-antigen ligase
VRLPLTLVALLFLLFNPRISRIAIGDARFVFLLFAMLYLTSTLWSVHPIVTLGKSVEIILAGVVFLEVSRSTDPLRRIDALREITLLTISLIALLTVAGFVLRISSFIQQRPGIFTSSTAQSVFLSGNGLGYVTSALFLVVLAEWQAGRIKDQSAFLQMGFALGLFSVAASRTSFVILLLSVLVILYRRSKAAAAMCSVIVTLLIVLFRNSILTHLKGNESTAGFETLSARTVLWTAALRQWHEHPLFGSGGGVGGKLVIENVGDVYLEKVSSLHNGFMELLMGLGAVGLLIGVYLLVQVTWRAWIAWRNHPEYSGTYVLIIHVWLTTIMSTGILGWMGYEMALFLCILANLDLLQEHRFLASTTPYRTVRKTALTAAMK